MNNNQNNYWVVEMMTKGDVAKKQESRKVWSIDLNTVLVPLMTATNAIGATSISREALGAPLRLSMDKKDGSVKFNSKGMPIFKVDPEITKVVTSMRENFIAGLVSQTQAIVTNPETADLYKAEAEAIAEIGAPIMANDIAIGKLATEKRRKAIVAEAIAHAQAESDAQALNDTLNGAIVPETVEKVAA
jgi:hypothetical protein